jgi:hypothetical protein
LAGEYLRVVEVDVGEGESFARVVVEFFDDAVMLGRDLGLCLCRVAVLEVH